MNYCLTNGMVFFKEGFKKIDIKIENDTIVEIGKNLSADKIIDCQGKIISPAFIDVHVHLREPGYTYKEDINSGTMSALRGGYSTIFAMPNTKPVIDSVEMIESFNQLVKEKANCNVKTFAAMSKGLKGEIVTDIEDMSKLNIAGFSDDGSGLQDGFLALDAFKRIAETKKIVSIHSEDLKELEKGYCINEGIKSKEFGLVGINNASEYKMLQRDLTLTKDLNLKYHLCHISTKESLEIIKNFKSMGSDVSCEVTAHHLVLNEEDIKKDDGNYKMNPPLRSKKDMLSLIEGLNNGDITIIASDHAPHSIEEKNCSFKDAMFGIIGLEQTFSVLNTFLIQPNIVSLETILSAMTYNPAERFNISCSLEIGSKANLTVIDLTKEKYVDANKFYSKSRNTMFSNINLLGDIEQTIFEGKIYDWRENE